MARAAAFVFAFAVLHSLPNALLLLPDGKQKYDDSVKDAHKLKLLPVFEVYLAASFALHGGVAMKSGWEKKQWVMLLTGCVISGFLVKHTLDFRFGKFREQRPSDHVNDVLKRRADKAVYILGIFAVALHVYKGIRPAWLFRLGFRGDAIRRLVLLGRLLTATSTALYLTPVLSSG